MLNCPEDATEPFLIPGHAYLFKWAEGWQQFQIWSEVIAYRIARVVGLDVPPCFLAVDEKADRVLGALVEIFYGYPDESQPQRFVHASGIMRLRDPKKGRPHDIGRNHAFAKHLEVSNFKEWWGRVLVFDALIGNTDRHPENWGFLISSEQNAVTFAPPFDNATSLGYEIRDGDLAKYMANDRLTAYIDKGTHHCDWDPAQPKLRQHIELCRRYLQAFPAAEKAMKSVLEFRQEDVDSILRDCTEFDVKLRFTVERAKFVSALIRERRRRLLALFGD